MSKKKNWIMIKRGLSEDPKHREAMGNRIWLFMHILNRADWETGIVYDWRDKDEAQDMAISWRTLQQQRQQLEDLGYITCTQIEQGQNITIHQWVNPKSYSGEILNNRGTKNYVQGGTVEGTVEGTVHPNGDFSTLPIQIMDQVSGINEGADAPTPPTKPAKPSKPRAELMDHPAVKAYRDEALNTPSIEARRAIANTVTDIPKWIETMQNFKINKWDVHKVVNLLDAYQNGSNGNKNNGRSQPANPYEGLSAREIWAIDNPKRPYPGDKP